MQAVRNKLAQLTDSEVEYLEEEGEPTFRLSRSDRSVHWLHIDAALAAEEGEHGVLARLAEVVPHLTTTGQSLRVRLMPTHVLAEPATD